MKRKSWIFAIVLMLFILPCTVLLSACDNNIDVTETGFKVKINGAEYTSQNNTVEIEYGEETENWRNYVEVFKVMSNGNEETIDFSALTIIDAPDNLEVNTTGYDISIQYKEYPSVAIKLIVNRKAVEKPTLIDDYDPTYGDDGDYLPINYDNESNAYSLSLEKDGSQISLSEYGNAGHYKATFVLNSNYKWQSEDVTEQTENIELIWQVDKRPIEINSIPANKTYNATEQTPDLSFDDNYNVVYKLQDGQTFKDAGTYDVILELIDSANYKWSQNMSENFIISQDNPNVLTIKNAFTIDKRLVTLTEFRQTSAPTYVQVMQGENPLNIACSFSDVPAGATFNYRVTIKDFNSEVVAYYVYSNDAWSLCDKNMEGIATLPAKYISSGTNYLTYYMGEIFLYGDEVLTNFEISNNNPVNEFTSLGVAPIIIDEQANYSLPAPTLTYNGSEQTTTVLETEWYTVTQAKGTNAFTYYGILTAKDNYAFAYYDDGVTKTKEFTLTITKAENSITDLTISDWVWGETKSIPTATALFGEIQYLYSTAVDGEYVSFNYLDTSSETSVGTYYLKAEVLENENYYSASTRPKEFKVLPKSIENFTLETYADYYWETNADDTNSLPEFKLKNGENTIEQTDNNGTTRYTASLVTEDGKKYLVVEGTGQYTGTLRKEIVIINSLASVLTNKKVEIYGKVSINETQTISDGRTIELYILQDGAIYSSTSTGANLFEVSEGTLNVCGGGVIQHTVQGDGATFATTGTEAHILINYSIKQSSYGYGILGVNTLKYDETATPSNFKAQDGYLTVFSATGYGKNFYSEYLNINACGGYVDIHGGEYITERGNILISNASSNVTLFKGREDVSYNDTYFEIDSQTKETKLVGIEMYAGSLAIYESVHIHNMKGSQVGYYNYINGEFNVGNGNLTVGDIGNVKGTIVFGKPSGYDANGDYAGDITINLVGGNINNSSSFSRTLLWDITNGYGTYKLNYSNQGTNILSSDSASKGITIKNGLKIDYVQKLEVIDLTNASITLNDIVTLTKDENLTSTSIAIEVDKITLADGTDIDVTGLSSYLNITYGELIDYKDSNLDNSYLKVQTITVSINIVTVYGTCDIVVYYLDPTSPETLSTGMGNLPNDGETFIYVTSLSDIYLPAQMAVTSININVIIPVGVSITVTTDASVYTADVDSLTQRDKSAFAIGRYIKQGSEIIYDPANVIVFGGGTIIGKQYSSIDSSQTALENCNLIYVEDGSSLTLKNVKVESADTAMNLIYNDGSLTIDETCSIISASTCIINRQDITVMAVLDESGVILTKGTNASFHIDNYGTIDLSDSDKGFVNSVTNEEIIYNVTGTIIPKSMQE